MSLSFARFVVSEAEAIGYEISTLIASDEDGGDQLTFRIDTGNNKNIFTIDYDTGELLLRKKLLFFSGARWSHCCLDHGREL